jgi:hypothetical protein
MSKAELENMKKLDELAEEAGGYVSPLFESNVHYDYRKLLSYCKMQGIDPLDLTLRELQNFLVPQATAI